MPLDPLWDEGPVSLRLKAYRSSVDGSILGFEREDGRFLNANGLLVSEEEYTSLISQPRSLPSRSPQSISQYTGKRILLAPRPPQPTVYTIAPSTATAGTPLSRTPISPPEQPLAVPANLAKAEAVADKVDDDQKALKTRQKSLDPEYKLRNNDFFIPGRIFACPWHETEGKRGTKLSQDVTTDRFGDKIYTTIRRWIVIKNKGSTSLCVPITTYSGRGCDKDGLPLDQIAKHTAICMVGQEAEVTKTEQEKGMRKDTICAVPASKKEKLNPKSRVNFGKYYHVEHNIKVREVGRVRQKDIHKVISYFNQSVQDDIE